MPISNWNYHQYQVSLSQEDEEFQFYSYFTEYKLKRLKFLKAYFTQFLWLSHWIGHLKRTCSLTHQPDSRKQYKIKWIGRSKGGQGKDETGFYQEGRIID